MPPVKPWSERLIARAISIQLLNRKCIVLLDNTTWTGHECDLLGVTMDLRLIDIEIKISRADLRRDAGKEKWWHRKYAGLGEEVREYFPDGSLKCVNQPFQYDSTALFWPPKIWKHYYALPAEIWKPELADSMPSEKSGILLLRKGRDDGGPPVVVNCMRRATPNRDADRISATDALDIARLANLRMHEAYKQIEELSARLSETQELRSIEQQHRSTGASW